VQDVPALDENPDNPILIRMSVPEDGPRLVAIWRSAVLSTHAFLAPSDFEQIDALVEQFLPQSRVWVAENMIGQRLGFMGCSDGCIESLFIEAGHRGRGIGRALIDHASQFRRVLTVDVNEQNEQAVGFYRYMGFYVTGRSPVDDQGLPYPILHMRRDR
jgi:putative acetyltransferase